MVSAYSSFFGSHLVGGLLKPLTCLNCCCLTVAFSGGSVGKESACNAGDHLQRRRPDLIFLSSVPGSGRSPGERNSNALHHSCLENPTDRGAWRATVCGVSSLGPDLVTKPPIVVSCISWKGSQETSVLNFSLPLQICMKPIFVAVS